MSNTIRERIDDVVNRGHVEDWLSIIQEIDSTDDLCYLLECYNWDDGFEIPTAIANHRSCDLGIALSLWWLADGASRFIDKSEVSKYFEDWATFCDEMTNRIAGENSYPTLKSKCIECAYYNESLRLKLMSLGLPEVFFRGYDQRYKSI